MKIEWEDASAVREKLSDNVCLEDLLVDAWQRIDELARRVDQLERAALSERSRQIAEVVEREAQIERIKQLQRASPNQT